MHSFATAPTDPGGFRSPSLTRPLSDEEEENGKLIFIIDDSPVICRIVEHSLAEFEITTLPFHSGIAALNALRMREVPIPDLVLLDIGMPHMNGYDVASLLNDREEFKSVPIVMLSGHDGIFNRLRAKHAGADDFIAKPFDKPELIRKIFPLLNLALPGPDSRSYF